MHLGTSDTIALLLAVLIAAGVTVALLRFDHREQVRRGWMVALVVFLIIVALGAMDIVRDPTHEVKLSTVIIAALFAVLATKGMVHATRRVPTWLRWLLAFSTAVVFLFVGLLTGATGVSRFLPF
jgi:UDP-N-acetylmuramyl pentapeptide phosphotransferase/UDP-N-acetylglucosamine-1-phosphate transferase